MLFWFVMGYWAISVAIGLFAAFKVRGSVDFVVAGRHLPFYMVTATVFATWFGSESVLGIPATFIDEGLKGIIADPFGSSMCLILAGLFFAAPLYRMKLLTIGDFYKRRFGRYVEIFTTLAICISYLGWVGAQITALGLVFNLVSGDMISQTQGMWIGSITILFYTYFGGMWAIAITDLLQMTIIVIGMIFIGHEIAGMPAVGGVSHVIDHARAAGKFEFWPDANLKAVLAFVSAWVTMMFGSIPQQDVFQRMQSAKTIRIAVWASVLGGVLYFFFTFIPMFLAYSATLVNPGMVNDLVANDKSQLILPTLILQNMPLFAQIVFFGALLSAIKSCASATLLAPSVMFTENILKPILPHLKDKQLLKLMRVVTASFTILVTFYAMYSVYSHSTIFEMVENAYQITLVAAFVPLLAGIFWHGATRQGAVLSIVAGVGTWGYGLLFFGDDPLMDAQLAGLCASAIGMVAGSLAPQWLKHDHSVHHALLRGDFAYDKGTATSAEGGSTSG